MKKQDLRSIRSEKNIKQAFIDLLQDQPFDKIKVSEIARKTGIDRQTFYLHYIDKYDLLDKMNKEFMQVFKPILLERLKSSNALAPEKIENIYHKNFPYLNKHRREILSLLKIDTGNICLKRDLKEFVVEKYQEISGIELTSFQQEMLANLYVSSLIIFIKENRKIGKKEMEDLLTYIRDFVG